MSQYPLEVILARQFADHLATPVILIDAEGTGVFWNEPAERFTGLRFDETGPIPRETWMVEYQGRDEHGSPIPTAELPVTVALESQRPAHRRHEARFFGEQFYDVEVSALPVVGQQERFLGVMVLIWSGS